MLNTNGFRAKIQDPAVHGAVAMRVWQPWFMDPPSPSRIENDIISAARPDETRHGAANSGRRRRGPGGMQITEYGTGPAVIFVHGLAFGGHDSWQAQLPLAERWRLVVVSRLNYDESSSSDREDYVEDGRLLVELLDAEMPHGGAHLVAQSYGTLGAMLAAAQRPEAVRSLTLIESAASAVARGTNLVDDCERAMRELTWVPPEDADTFFRAMFATIEPRATFPDPLPASLRAFAERSREPGAVRWPWDAEPDEFDLRLGSFPKLVVSGGRRPLFEAISDALAERLGAERVVIPGGHGTQNVGGPFNDVLETLMNQKGGRR